jgi:hypothetical protein
VQSESISFAFEFYKPVGFTGKSPVILKDIVEYLLPYVNEKGEAVC